MSNRVLLWQAWSQSKTFQQRPSELVGIKDSYVAYCFDEAVRTFGEDVEEYVRDVSEGRGNAKTKKARGDNALRRMLGMEQKFRDPASAVSRDDGSPKEPPPFPMRDM